MIKTKTVLEIKVNERVYEVYCVPESPLGELFDALTQFRGYVAERIAELDVKPESQPACCGAKDEQ